MPLVLLKLLGKFEGTLANGRQLSLRNRKSRALLAYLALHHGEKCRREALAGLLWGDRAETQARRSLRQALTEIRAALGDGARDALVATRDAVEVRLADVDAITFDRLVGSSKPEGLTEAESLYRGPLLDGAEAGTAAFDAWVTVERERFQEMARHVLEALTKEHLKRNDADAALRTARRLTSLDSFDEAGHRLVMQALAASGRRNDALTHYDRIERLLREELGVAPLPETTTLRDSLRRTGRDVAIASAPLTRDQTEVIDERPAVAILPFDDLSDGATNSRIRSRAD